MTTTAIPAKHRRFAKPALHYAGVWARYIVLIFWCVTTIFPFVWTILSAFKDNPQIYGRPLALPNPIVWGNYSSAWVGTNIITTGMNSLIYAVATVLLVMCVATPAAFFCAKIAKKKWMHLFFTSGIMIPVHAILIPCFISIRDMGMYNTRQGIVIIYVAANLSFSIFVLTAFMKSALPDEIIEASVIDGCGTFRAFLNMVPLCKTGLVTAITFMFLGVWNEMLFAMCVLPNPALRTLNIACISLKGQFISDQGLLSAALVLLIVPAVIIYTLFQEQVVKGLTAGAVKG
jgi:ABC-type glycerol-3-phosphate transport system permease component